MCVYFKQACRAKGVDCIVAPYEADSQLAYLNRIGIAQIIITEDSDLVLFGCERVGLLLATTAFTFCCGVYLQESNLLEHVEYPMLGEYLAHIALPRFGITIT